MRRKQAIDTTAEDVNRPWGSLVGNQNAVGHHGSNGHTKFKTMTQQLISQLNDEVDDVVKAKNGGQDVRRKVKRLALLVNKLITLGCEGNLEAIKYIFDRVDGKMIQPLALPVPGDEGDGLYEFTLRLGHRAIDGSETATEVRLRPAVDVPQAAGGDLRAAGHNGGAR